MDVWMMDGYMAPSVSVNVRARSGCPGPADRQGLMKGPVTSGL